MSEHGETRPGRRLSGTHITIIVVAALVTLVPGAAIAVTAASSTIVDPKTGSPAYVTNHQLNVRGAVGEAGVVPTEPLTIYRADVQIGKPLGGILFLQSDAQGRDIEIGSMNVTGYTLDGDFEIFLFTHDVSLPGVCTTNPPPVGPGDPGVVFEGLNPGGGGTHQLSWTFPIPLVIEPRANQRTCLYAELDGYDDVEQISMFGAWALPR